MPILLPKEKGLTLPGLEVARKKQEDASDYNGIDTGIRELCKNLNHLTFLATDASCQGHLYNKADKVILAGDEVFLWAERYIIYLIQEYQDVNSFLTDSKPSREVFNLCT